MKPIDDYDLRPEPPARFQLSRKSVILLCLAVALFLLAPCFWQPHILAGDIPSHVYNAWLASQVKQGRIADLIVTTKYTNVLTDWAFEFLLRTGGRAWAERVVVGLSVEIFFWGAFFFVAKVAGRRCWIVAPSLAMLAYGLILQMGFVNFYLATGISLWILALWWKPGARWRWLALPLAALALLAHALPLVWAVTLLGYVYVLRLLSNSQRVILLIGGFCALVLLQTILMSVFKSEWSVDNLVGQEGVLALTGSEQLWLWGYKYWIPVAGILLVWFALFLERLDRGGLLSDPIAHVWMLSMGGLVLLPSGIQFPHYNHALLYIPQRISLFVALSFCAMVAGSAHGRKLARVSCLVAAVFFAAYYIDAQAMNRLETEIAVALASVPQGARVTLSLEDSNSLRLNGISHLAEPLCIERCWAYGNFEAPTRAFRVEATGANAAVVTDMESVWAIENGTYIVKAGEAPLYSLCPGDGPANPLVFRKLMTGERVCKVSLAASTSF